MPTEPLKTILDRDLSKVGAKKIIDIAAPLLQEVVNYSTNVLGRCIRSSKDLKDVDFPVLSLYKNMIEMTDGIEVLISQCCTIPAIPLLRSSFETLLSIEYILEDNYENRALACHYEYIKNEHDYGESLLTYTERGKAYKKAIENDKYLQGSKIELDTPEIKDLYEKCKKKINDPIFNNIKCEKQKIKKQTNRWPRWYELFNGPRTIEQLAKHLNRAGQYQTFYREWSHIIHGLDFSRFLIRNNWDNYYLEKLRNPEYIYNSVNGSSQILIDTTRLILKKFRQDENENFVNWYKNEVKKRSNILSN